jgi:hypothetical protein
MQRNTCVTYQTAKCCSQVCGISIRLLVTCMLSSAGSFLPAEILTCPQCQARHMPHSGPELVILFQLVYLTANNSFKSCNHCPTVWYDTYTNCLLLITFSRDRDVGITTITTMHCHHPKQSLQKMYKPEKVPNSIFFKYIALHYHLFSIDTVSGSRSAPTSKSIVTEGAHNFSLLSVPFMYL